MRIAALVGLGMALAGSNAFGQDVAYDYAKGTDFSKLKTYSWVQGKGLNDELNHKRIVAAVDAQLAAKGMIQAAAGSTPDVTVSYRVEFDKSIEVTGFASGPGWRFGGMRTGTARAEEVLSGSLAVDMVDPRAGSIVWRSVASKIVDVKADPEKRDKNIAKAAEKLFKNYPPER
jgi:hypothetical protein